MSLLKYLKGRHFVTVLAILRIYKLDQASKTCMQNFVKKDPSVWSLSRVHTNDHLFVIPK